MDECRENDAVSNLAAWSSFLQQGILPVKAYAGARTTASSSRAIKNNKNKVDMPKGNRCTQRREEEWNRAEGACMHVGVGFTGSSLSSSSCVMSHA